MLTHGTDSYARDYKHRLVELQRAHSIAGRARVIAAVSLKDRLRNVATDRGPWPVDEP
jgi:hypothetical protein